ncbi:hypothetical protein D3C86_1054290 [compost metagenome]
MQVVFELQDAGSLAHSLIHLRFRAARETQAEGHVLEHAEMRIKRIVLEHHRDTAIGRFDGRDITVVDGDMAAAGLLKTSDHAQQCGFAAAGRPDEDRKTAGRDFHRDIPDRSEGAEGLGDIVETDTHGRLTEPSAAAHGMTAPARNPSAPRPQRRRRCRAPARHDPADPDRCRHAGHSPPWPDADRASPRRTR